MKTDKTITLNIPISKIDEEQRIVTGIVTGEEVDSQGDIVDYKASKKAFKEWKGNIREMHGDTAVGKAIDIQFDDKNKQVSLSSYISESTDGQNAWTKIKEGILTGYSIGGRVFEVAKDKNVEGANRILDYSLSETSLVDNPAYPKSEFVLVKSIDGNLQRVETIQNPHLPLPQAWWVSKFARPEITKGGVAVLDGDARNEKSTSVTTVLNGSPPASGGTVVPKKVYGADGKSTTNKYTKADLKKDFWGVSIIVSLAIELSYFLQSEMAEGDTETVAAVQAALDSLKAAAQSELNEDNQAIIIESIEYAQGVVDLCKSKEKTVKKTNVIAGEERDTEAVVTETAEEAGRPANDTTERAAESGVLPIGEPLVDDKGEPVLDEDGNQKVQPPVAKTPVADDTESDDGSEDDDKSTGDVKDGKEKKSDDPTTLLKNVETLLTKLSDEGGNVELKKATDAIKSDVGKVVKSMTALEDRIKKLEDQPVPTKGKQYQVIGKGDEEGEVSEDVKALLKRQEELISRPHDAKPGEMADLAMKLRKAHIGEPITIS